MDKNIEKPPPNKERPNRDDKIRDKIIKHAKRYVKVLRKNERYGNEWAYIDWIFGFDKAAPKDTKMNNLRYEIQKTCIRCLDSLIILYPDNNKDIMDRFGKTDPGIDSWINTHLMR
jgi:hypothetical protein